MSECVRRWLCPVSVCVHPRCKQQMQFQIFEDGILIAGHQNPIAKSVCSLCRRLTPRCSCTCDSSARWLCMEECNRERALPQLSVTTCACVPSTCSTRRACVPSTCSTRCVWCAGCRAVRGPGQSHTAGQDREGGDRPASFRLRGQESRSRGSCRFW